MTRKEYLNKLKTTYQFVHTIVDKDDYAIYHLRHKQLKKDLILRYYNKKISAYDELLKITCKNLPEIYDVIYLNDGTIVFEEYINGITVADVMANEKYRYRGVKKVITSVCYALNVLHERNLVHRDVKPENILIDNTGRVVLIDFNASKKMSSAKKDTVIMGTVGYISPEQLGIAQSDERTDIYALGILLNVMLTGKHPSVELAKGKAGRIVRKCTNVNPDERFQNVIKLIDAL